MEGDAAAAFANKFTAHCNDPWGDLSIVYSMNEYLDDKKLDFSMCALLSAFAVRSGRLKKSTFVPKTPRFLKKTPLLLRQSFACVPSTSRC
jgi:hypothetical protein